MSDAGPTESQEEARGAAANFYTANISNRDPYLRRARRLSSVTLPNLFRLEGATGSDDEELPWSSFGGYVVNNLAASLVFSLFPPGRAPMKINQDRKAAVALQNDPSLSDDEKAMIPAAIMLGLAQVENEFSDAMEEDGDRAKLVICAARMIVGGQHGFQFYPDGTLRGIPLDYHVTQRDPSGKLIAFGIMDALAWATLPAAVRAVCEQNGYMEASNKDLAGAATINVYTYGWVGEDGRWTVYEEVWGQMVADTKRTYSAEDMPYFFPTWTLLEKEHYGRAYCEDYEADLQTAEGLTQTIVEGSAAAARFLTFVNPTGLTSRRAVAEADNGAVLAGRGEDVTSYVSGKQGDLMIAQNEKGEVIDRLSKSFLLNTSIQRNAERVTAEEIRYVAQELEKLQGGVYSLAVVQWQSPYCRLKLKALQATNRVTALPKGTTKIKIIGGLAALGRSADADALKQAMADAIQMYGPQAVMAALGPDQVRVGISRLFAAYGVDPQGILPTADQAKQIDQQAQQQALIQQLGPEAIKQVGNNLTATSVAGINADAKTAAAGPGPGGPPPQAQLPAPESPPQVQPGA